MSCCDGGEGDESPGSRQATWPQCQDCVCHCQQHNETGSVKDLLRCGRPKKTTDRQDSMLIRTGLTDRRLTSPELRAKLDRDHGVSVSASTVRSRLLRTWLRGFVAAKKPWLTPATRNTAQGAEDGGHTGTKRAGHTAQQEVTNVWVGTYNPYLIRQFNCHISMLKCAVASRVNVVNYFSV